MKVQTNVKAGLTVDVSNKVETSSKIDQTIKVVV
jgi:hypothetical protein